MRSSDTAKFSLEGAMPFWSKKRSPDPSEASCGLRNAALSSTAQDLGLSSSSEHPNVFGVLMETGFREGAATLTVFAEGSTSLYFSNGGGVIGAGQHESVRKTHGPLFREAEAHLTTFKPVEDTELPSAGRVRFYLRTFSETLGAEAKEDDLGNMRHPLSGLFHAAQATIAAVRESSTG
jgi:hypothetical protein